jgi:hypothetical protein
MKLLLAVDLHPSDFACSAASVALKQLPNLVLRRWKKQRHRLFCFMRKGDLCGLKQIGTGQIEYARLIPLLGVRTI